MPGNVADCVDGFAIGSDAGLRRVRSMPLGDLATHPGMMTQKYEDR